MNEGGVLEITLAADLFASDDAEVANDIDLLLRLSAREQGFRVTVNGADIATDWQFVHRTTYSAENCSENPGLVDTQHLVDALNESGKALTLFDTVAQLMMSDRGAGGLFVTCDENILTRRFERQSMFSGRGIVTTAEAVSLAYSVQRGRGLFTLDQPQVLMNVGETGFFSSLTRNQLPNAIAAYRTLLDPENPAPSPALLELVESMMGKYHSLLLETDDCGRRHLSEGLYGGNFSALRRYQATAESSLVLVSGLMDIAAHVVAELGGKKVSNPNQISWRHLVAADNNVYRGLSDSALVAQQAAQMLRPAELTFVSEIRNLYAHRTSLPGSNSSYRDTSGAIEYAEYCVLSLGTAADLRDVEIPEAFLGTFCDGNELPFYFQLKLVALAQEIIESITQNLDNSRADWYREVSEVDQAAQDGACAARWWRLDYELHPLGS